MEWPRLLGREVCRWMNVVDVCTGKANESVVTGYANTPTNKVVVVGRIVDTTDHKGDAPTGSVDEHPHVKKSTKFVDRGVNFPAVGE
ncbi:hypothetical protein Plhal304r1_c045g0125861 [Plasmopara halstedii]